MQTIRDRWLSVGAWILALMLVALVGVLASKRGPATAQVPEPIEVDLPSASPEQVDLPDFSHRGQMSSISRQAAVDTIIPSRSRDEVLNYTVGFGDSVFGIAEKFEITPESVLWANYDLLNDNPDFLEPGMELLIPPVNGIYYQWQAGDTLDAVAERYETSAEEIVDFSGNDLDLTEPVIDPGTWVMVPGGKREFRRWLVPAIPRGSAGVSKELYGPGACAGGYSGGAVGSGAFVWPAGNHTISGNDYWSGHLGIDVAAGEGLPIFASDAGVVVFSGWATGGYGYMVMIDHGNGYQSLYAHLGRVVATCGSSVSQGQTIGYGGNTGNSTGPHLHFEVRSGDGFINPWFVLPAP